MKIFELENDSVLSLFEPNKRVDLDLPAKWARRPLSPSGHPSVPSSIVDRRTVNIGSAGKLKLHVLDLGRLKLDKNFMVANSTVATARTPNPRGQIIEIPVSAYYIEHADGNILFDTGCHPDWGARMADGRSTDCRNCSRMSAARNACYRPGLT
jgi:hypothetical protein